KRTTSGTRVVDMTVATGFRFGVTTWNMHGFQKSAKVTIEESLKYEEPLAKVEQIVSNYQKLYNALCSKVAESADVAEQADARQNLYREMEAIAEVLRHHFPEKQIPPPSLDTQLWTIEAQKWCDQMVQEVSQLPDGNKKAAQQKI